jgi:hypothetical protein
MTSESLDSRIGHLIASTINAGFNRPAKLKSRA